MPRRLRFSLVLAAACVAGGLACRAPESSPAASAPRRDIDLHADTRIVRGAVPRDATLESLLRGQGLAAPLAERVIAAVRTVFDPRRLRSLQPFSLERTVAGALRAFEYEIDGESFLRVTPAVDDTTLRAEVLPIPKTLEHAVAAGTIGGGTPSLFQAMDAAGERVDLALALADIFSGEIDFNSDLQPGDGFAVAFERFRREGRPVSYGVITAAEFRNDGRVLQAIRFTPPGGKPGYYDMDGRSVHRFFLRSPLKFEPRVTSGFSLGRMHPVLHLLRAHRGVDYAAPTGAPVVAVAAGTVRSVTFDDANGRMVRIRHASGYESYYLHLSAFAAGLHAGAQVAQGETIGLVGSTGLATGPHLHFGLTLDGAFVNPLAVRRDLPPGDPIPPSAMPAFEAVRDEARAALAAAGRQPDVTRVAEHGQEPAVPGGQ